ncbi:hypothetical protein BN137_2949 [Cronobacter condimenti 1330]|uniref:Uncharacterized protein n=1 Tax=Cronobacter condimenti 1330 TaxID=1073999 RepID=K8AH58_9ENTR|nr:hypothetical protein BN137_2949 [Cronobacter condimenti 1330]
MAARSRKIHNQNNNRWNIPLPACAPLSALFHWLNSELSLQ